MNPQSKHSPRLNGKARPAKNPLIGQFFHSLKSGQICWQGRVISEPMPGVFLVQLYEWAFGEPNVRRMVKAGDMVDWLFYPTAEDWNYSAEHGVARVGGPYRTSVEDCVAKEGNKG